MRFTTTDKLVKQVSRTGKTSYTVNAIIRNAYQLSDRHSRPSRWQETKFKYVVLYGVRS